MNRFDEQRALLLWSGVSLRRRRILASGNLTKRMLAVIAAGLVTRKPFEVRAVCHRRGQTRDKSGSYSAQCFTFFNSLAIRLASYFDSRGSKKRSVLQVVRFLRNRPLRDST